MSEKKELEKLHGMLQFAIYLLLAIEFVIFLYGNASFWGAFAAPIHKLGKIAIYKNVLWSKLFVLLVICLVSIGTLSKKNLEFDPRKHIIYPLAAGLLLFFGGIVFYALPTKIIVFPYTTIWDLAYMLTAIVGAILIHVAMDNVSKMIKSNLGKDKWNVEGESFMQPTVIKETPYSVNIPMKFYYKRKVHDGFINIVNPFRATFVIGTPGSGKSFGVINPFIRQLIAKEFTMMLYDFKFPDLGQIAYYNYLLAKQKGKLKNFEFHVVNLNQVEKSRRINPLRADYITTLADAAETAEALIEALKKGDKSGGADAFFTQSAVNFLASCVYFFARYRNGKYSTLPHVLAFLNRSYEEIFYTLFSNPELASLMSPFQSAFKAKAFDQLEGQVGTLKVFISRLATKETFWVFSGDDINLKISDPETPSILVLANDPATQNINSACYSVVLNRMTRLINTKHNLPSALIIDELPTLYVYKVENLIATARSNKVAVVMGLQELPQFKQGYGKDSSDTITSVVGNVLSGSVRNKETLDWLEKIGGKVKQLGESVSIDRNKTSVSINEKLESLLPAGKISSLKTGEMVGVIADDVNDDFDGNYESSAVNCKINLNMNAIKQEEANYRALPSFYNFGSPDEREKILLDNLNTINQEVETIIQDIME